MREDSAILRAMLLELDLPFHIQVYTSTIHVCLLGQDQVRGSPPCVRGGGFLFLWKTRKN